jgi:ArsR family transcriptional regulator, arsenate/arsenite/antimonite-responsive transcriptional repressor
MMAPKASPVLDEAAAVAALAALSQVSRLRIFRALVDAGPRGLTPSELAAGDGLAGSTLSFHLKELVFAGLVHARRDGRYLIYRPDVPRMNALLDYLTAHCCDGADCGPKAQPTADA